MESNAVILPCSTKDFGRFISELLGKPQTIHNSLRGSYELKREDVLNVHALLMQRVGQQNEAVLTQFTAKLMFSDNSSVLLNSIEDFSTYHEVRPVACIGLHLSWVFLVKFNDKSHPEKQEIDLSFLTGHHVPTFDEDVHVVMWGGRDTGVVVYRIAHTARSWGSDIDALLRSHLASVIEEVPKIHKWLARHNEKVAMLVFAGLILCSIGGTLYSATSFVARQKTLISQLGEITSGGVTPNHMAYLLDTVASGTWERFLLTSIVFLLFSFVVSVLVAIWVGSTADNLPPSFLLLTKESEKRKNKILAKRKVRWFSFAGSLLVGLAVGVAGNICYALWFERLIK